MAQPGTPALGKRGIEKVYAPLFIIAVSLSLITVILSDVPYLLNLIKFSYFAPVLEEPIHWVVDLIALFSGLAALAFFRKKLLSFVLGFVSIIFTTTLGSVLFPSYWIFDFSWDWPRFIPFIGFAREIEGWSNIHAEGVQYQLFEEAIFISRCFLAPTVLAVGTVLAVVFIVLSVSQKSVRSQYQSPQETQGAYGATFQSRDLQQQHFVANWIIAVPGYSQEPLNVMQLRQMASTRAIYSSTPLKDVASGNIFTAKTVPGIFSQCEYVTALLLSIFLGGLGIDRFYLGHTGLGIAKLLTAGGCGVWSLIDLILIAMRKVHDYEGMPLG